MTKQEIQQQLLNDIPSASDSRFKVDQNEFYKTGMKKSVDSQNQRIQQAIANGLSFASFYAYPEYEYDLKQMYLKKGYSFRPVGIIGGVRQEGEYICW